MKITGQLGVGVAPGPELHANLGNHSFNSTIQFNGDKIIMRLLRSIAAALVIGIASVTLLAACSPEVGSKEWCEGMKEKDKGNWTANDAKDFAKHCIL